MRQQLIKHLEDSIKQQLSYIATFELELKTGYETKPDGTKHKCTAQELKKLGRIIASYRGMIKQKKETIECIKKGKIWTPKK